MSTHDDEPDGAHTHVLLLRGVNIGGRNRTPKAELAALAERAGAREVTVYLNSGNVLCRMPDEDASATAEIAERLRRLLAERLGVDTSVHVAAREELSGLLDVLAGSELCGADEGLDELDPKRVHLVLFGRAPDADAAAALQEPSFQTENFGPDRCLVAGRGVWIRYAADSRSSRLTLPRLERLRSGRGQGADSGPDLIGTARNLRTVRVLAGRPEPKIDLPSLPPLA